MKSFLLSTWELAKTIFVVALLAWVLKSAVIQPFVIDGMSMEPSFSNNEYILVNKISYKVQDPQRGDVVVFKAPDNPQYDYIKRIIGLPGDIVAVKNGKVFINNKELDEKYIKSETIVGSSINGSLETVVAKDDYFVMGDNRNHSTDSREFGQLPKENIVGKAWVVLYPKPALGFVKQGSYTLENTSF